MFVRELGSGPVVLLLHGTPSPAADWLPVAKALEDRYRVLVPDLPGYGQSPPPVPASVDHVGDLILEMLAEHGVTALRAIAGFSSGAYRALHLVLRKRDLRPDLSTLVPRLYLRVGDTDAGAPPAWSKEISDRAPHATLDVVAGKGHSLLIEDLAATTAAILAAVDRGA